MDQLKDDILNADPFKTWWPIIISTLVGLAITIRWVIISFIIIITRRPTIVWYCGLIQCHLSHKRISRNYSGGKKYLGKPNHRGRWFIVTGANGGIGREVCKELAIRGANVILACRTMNKRTEAQLQYFRKKFPNSEFELLALDLSSLDSVRAFAREVGEYWIHKLPPGILIPIWFCCREKPSSDWRAD